MTNRQNARRNLYFNLFCTVPVLIIVLSFQAIAQTWTSNGPNYKVIKVITQSPTNSNILYAGAFGFGVFKSTNGGLSWTNQRTGMVNSYVRSIFALNDNTVFVGTNDGVYKTVDGGVTWAYSLTTLNSVRSIAYDASTTSLYAATYGTGLFKSTNQGTSWTSITVKDPVTNQTSLHQWAVAVYASNSLYVGGLITEIDSGGSLFRSIDGGSHWSQVQRGFGIRSSVHSIALDPNNPTTGLIIGTAAKGVYRSVNSGVNWSSIDGPTTTHPLADPKINTVGFTSTQFFAGTDSLGNFYYRNISDATVGWLTGTGLPGSTAPVMNIRIDASNSSVVYIGTEGRGVYKSSNGGSTWQVSNSGMMGTAGRVVERNGNGDIILGTDLGDGIWVSSNLGGTWTKQDSLSTSDAITSLVATNNPLILYAGAYGTGIFKSIDGGHIWHITDSTVINHFVRTASVHPTDLNTVYAGTGNGVFKTTNGGTTWFAANSGIPFSTSIRSMALDKTNPNVVYAGSDSSYMYKTTDGGVSWSHITSTNGFLTQDIFIRTITIDYTLSSTVYAGSDTGRIYQSTNAGANWSLLYQLPSTFSVRSILINPHDRNNLFASTFGSGIFVSVDGGSHWNQFNNGLSDLSIYTIESDTATPLNLYAGSSSNGVFHTTYSFTNHPPILAAIGSKSIFAGQTLSFLVSGSDSDFTPLTLSVRLLPSGASFIDSSNGHGKFTWIPSIPQAGSYFLTFIASDGIFADSEIVHITVFDPGQSQLANYQEDAGWNLISVPMFVNDFRKTILYPTATSPAYTYHRGYVARDTLMMGIGYWLKFPSSQPVPVNGIKLPLDSIDVDQRWNIIGSVSFPVPITRVKPVPPLSIGSPYYAYEGGQYVPVDTLKPGRGYWIKVSQAGKLVLDTAATAAPLQLGGIRNMKSDPLGHNFLDRLNVIDAQGRSQTLYIPKENQTINPDQFELPPVPPADAFDVRFESQRSIANIDKSRDAREEYPLLMSGVKYPLTFSWNVSPDNGGWILELSENVDNVHYYDLIGQGNAWIDAASLFKATLIHDTHSAHQIPSAFELQQNYPNPFNPVTEIRYALKSDAHVTLKIYNMLGQVILTVVNNYQTAGYQKTSWNASEITSGVYYYILQASNPVSGKLMFQGIKKMVLLK